jgi:hypothetical protein
VLYPQQDTCSRLSQSLSHSAVRRISYNKKYDLIGNRIGHLPAYRTVPQPITLQSWNREFGTKMGPLNTSRRAQLPQWILYSGVRRVGLTSADHEMFRLLWYSKGSLSCSQKPYTARRAQLSTTPCSLAWESRVKITVYRQPVLACGLCHYPQSLQANSITRPHIRPQQLPYNSSLIIPPINPLFIYITNKQKQTPWPLVRKRIIPTERPPLVDEI